MYVFKSFYLSGHQLLMLFLNCQYVFKQQEIRPMTWICRFNRNYPLPFLTTMFHRYRLFVFSYKVCHGLFIGPSFLFHFTVT